MPILAAQVLGVAGNRRHGVQCGLEQEILDHGLVLVGDGSDLGRQREDDVKVGESNSGVTCVSNGLSKMATPGFQQEVVSPFVSNAEGQQSTNG